MGKIGLRICCLALASLLLPSFVLAAGLGRLTVLSALGEPLRAEIEIVSVQPGEAETLVARLAPQAAFKQANIERSSALFDVRFAVERRPDAQNVIVLTSNKPMNEPFLDLLLELNWAGGRLIREYTFLLDPPEYRGPAVASPTLPVTPPSARPLAEPAPSRAPEVAAPTKPAPAPTAAAPATAQPGAATYQVRRGDTLSRIAQSNMPAGVSLQQMLVALYRSNQDAFIGNNMNRLRAGRILNIPDREAALSIAHPEARKVVSAQTAEYAEYQRSVGAAVAATEARPEASRQAAGRITPATPEKPTPPAEASRDQLRLSKPDDAKGAAKAGSAVASDDAVARNKALRDAQERIALLEKNIADLKKVQEGKSAAGAQAQKQAEAAKAPAAPAKPEPQKADAGKAPAPAAKADAAKSEPTKAPAPPVTTADAKAAPAAEAGRAPDVAKAAPDATKKAAEPAKAGEPAKAADAPKAAPKAAAKAAPPPPSLLDELLDNVFALAGIALVVVLLIGYAAFAWRKKKKTTEQRFSSSMMGSLPAESSAVMGTAGGQSVDTGSSVLTDFSQGGAKADADEIDPVAEADVYMAYGRDAQAEEILKEALARDPQRLAVRLKLLEVYANRKDARAFEAAAKETQAILGGQGPDWDKVVALGQQVDPTNPLYGGSGEKRPADLATAVALGQAALATSSALEGPATEPATAPPIDFDLDLGGTPAVAQPDINLDAALPASDQTVSIDFDLDLGGDKPAEEKKEDTGEGTVVLDITGGGNSMADGTVMLDASPLSQSPAPVETPAAETSGIDFDLGFGDASSAPVAVAPEPEPERIEPALSAPPAMDFAASNIIDFDLKLDDLPAVKPEVKQDAEATVATLPDFDLSVINLDLGSDATPPTEGVDSKWQEVATKLDLAKAYEEMGDKDGARDLLNEVIREGDSAQQQKAKSMLEALV